MGGLCTTQSDTFSCEYPVLFQAAIASSHAYPLVKQTGAQGYLCLPCHPQDLLAARDAALKGETYYPR